MKKEHLITVCLSVFRDISDLYHGAVIDTDGMFEANQVTKLRLVTFQFESDLPDNEQLMYSCQTKHISGVKFHNTAVKDLFYISPGRRPNSIFAYRQIGAPNFVKLIFYVENFDFVNLRPSHPSETEVRNFELINYN